MAIFKSFFASLQAILFTILTLFGVINDEAAYAKILDDSNMFDNTYAESIAHPDIYKLFENHFNDEDSTKTKKCLIVGYDGARAEAVLNVVEGESGILSIRDEGGLYLAYTGGNLPYFQDSSTATGWATLLTGKWCKGKDGHGVSANGVIKSNKHLTIMTKLIEEGKISSSAFIVSWGGHFTADKATYKDEISYTAEKGYNMLWDTQSGDEGVFASALAQIEDENGADFTFAILEHCDSNGHGTGFGNDNPNYVEGFKQGDLMGKQLIDAISARENYENEDWLILITSDHGGIGTGHGGLSSYEREIFFASNKEWAF